MTHNVDRYEDRYDRYDDRLDRYADGRYGRYGGNTKLYVGHLPKNTRTRDVEHLFSRYGRVRYVDLKYDYGFVEFSDPRHANVARYELDGLKIHGSRIIVQFAKGTPRGPGGSRDYTGRGSGRCANCGTDGHWARDCNAADWENKCCCCGEKGHIERDCKNSPTNLKRGRSYSRSPSPRRERSRSRSYSRGRKSYSRSPSPRRNSREEILLPGRDDHGVDREERRARSSSYGPRRSGDRRYSRPNPRQPEHPPQIVAMSGGGGNPRLNATLHSGPAPNYGLNGAPALQPPRAASSDPSFQFRAAPPCLAPPHFHQLLNAVPLPAPPTFQVHGAPPCPPAPPNEHARLFNAVLQPAPPTFQVHGAPPCPPAPPNEHAQQQHPQFHQGAQLFSLPGTAQQPAAVADGASSWVQSQHASSSHFEEHSYFQHPSHHEHQRYNNSSLQSSSSQLHGQPYDQQLLHQGYNNSTLQFSYQQPPQQRYHHGYNGGSSQLQQQPNNLQSSQQERLHSSQQQPHSTMPQCVVVAPPPPLQPNYTSLPEKRHWEDGESQDCKRIKLTMQVNYIPVMDFLDKNPPIEPYKFKGGSIVGSIPADDPAVKITEIGANVLDGYVGLFGDLHDMNKSFGGEFDESDLLVSENPFSVTINKVPKCEASWDNISKDYNKVVTCLVMKRYSADGTKPAYADEFISLVNRLPGIKYPRRAITLWIIRHHPLFIESAKRRLVFEDFYKFYKTLNPRVRDKLLKSINRHIYHRWHLLIAPKDPFISYVYWKGREDKIPVDHFDNDYSKPDAKDEKVEIYPFTSADGYLAALLRHLIVHGSEDLVLTLQLLDDVELEELDLIIAYHFGNFLPAFLAEISSVSETYRMLKEILITYSYRRSVLRRVPG